MLVMVNVVLTEGEYCLRGIEMPYVSHHKFLARHMQKATNFVSQQPHKVRILPRGDHGQNSQGEEERGLYPLSRRS
jgi:hypothetical protein